MGFEQLASLKKQLAQQAKSTPKKEAAKKEAVKKPRPVASAPATPSAPVDPVVHTIGKLQKRFPLAFPKNPAPKVALKVGVMDDLLTQSADLRLSEQQLKDAIKVWCRGSRYWSCLVEGAPRVDLAGNPVGEVTAADAGRAQHLKSRLSTRAARAPAAAPTPTPAPAPAANDGQADS